MISGIIFVIRNGLRWRDAPPGHGPRNTIYNRFVRWSRLGVFNEVFAELARKAGKPSRLMIDATHLKAHRDYCDSRHLAGEFLNMFGEGCEHLVLRLV